MTRQQFLRSRGWKRKLGWWFKPLLGLDYPWFNQRIYGTCEAFEEERLALMRESASAVPEGVEPYQKARTK